MRQETKKQKTRPGVMSVICISMVLFSQAAVSKTPVDKNWLAGIKKELIQKEYAPSVNQKGLQTPNRAHNLRIYYTERGIQVHDRTAKDEPLLVSMHLSQYGRGEQLNKIKPTKPVNKGKKIEYNYDNAITEWFDNSTRGLEHGFHLKTKPKGESEIKLVLSVEGATIIGQNDTGILLITTGGRRLQYDTLKVFDADNKPVTARMQGNGKHITLAIDDRQAKWPLLVDPLLTSTTDIVLEANQANAAFGISVANAGDVNGDGYSDVIVGANFYDKGENNEGVAFVYYGGSDGLATTDSVQLEANLADASFGVSVAGAGDVNGDGYSDVIVGAYLYENGETDEGAAFVYLGGSGGLSSTFSTRLESNQVLALFGFSVAGAGDVNGDGYSDVIVGAHFYDNVEDAEGGAFIYHGSAEGVSTTASRVLKSNQAIAHFGVSVSGAGDVNGDGYSDVIVGAHLFDNGESNEGAAFVYHGGSNGISPTANAQLEANQPDTWFGYSVAGVGDVNGDGYSDVIVGAHLYDNGENDEGAAFVYYGGAGGINTNIRDQLESNRVGAHLGISVAGAGDVNGDGYSDVIVGAHLYSNVEIDEGAVFVYLGTRDGLVTTASVQWEFNQANTQFGRSVAGAGDVNGDGYSDVIVGAANYDNGEQDEGGAFVYYGGAGGISTMYSKHLETNRPNSQFGISVASAGDVNGDGYSDAIVGAWAYDNGEFNEGAAFVYHGGAGGLSTTASVQWESNQVEALFGHSVSNAGDVNGDGYSDVIVGAHFFDNSEDNEGAAFVYLGGPGGLSTTASVQLESNQAGAQFGITVASAGDVNGDGYSDVIVGAETYDNGQSDEGAAFVYHGGSSGLNTTVNTKLESNQQSTWFGRSVAGAGDVNGDGYSDVIVGAPFYDNGQADEGAAFVYLGGSSGLSSTTSVLLQPNVTNAQFGFCVASAGDVNGDGYSDVIVGASHYDNIEIDEGAAFVYLGGRDGLSATAHAQWESNQVGAWYGRSVASAGDINGDGYSDVIVGANYYDNGQNNEGAAFVYHGGIGGLSSSADMVLESNQADAEFGRGVASAGDVNGDGYSDVIVGANFYDNGQNNEGAAFVFHGNSNGRLVQARQYRQNTTVSPVSRLGGSYAAGQFTVSLHVTHPKGRGAAKLQVESCPHTVPFGDPACVLHTQSGWTPISGGAGLVLSQIITKPAEGLYQWRARQLMADEMVLKPGITPPSNPSHGPWRRLAAHADNADIRVSNFLNDAPVIELGTGDFHLKEDVAVGTLVTTIKASDIDGNLPSYRIKKGNEEGRFAINNNTGVITTAKGLDFETTTLYSMTIEASDGSLVDESVVRVFVENVSDIIAEEVSGESSPGCSLKQDSEFDPLLPTMLLLGLVYLFRRHGGSLC